MCTTRYVIFFHGNLLRFFPHFSPPPSHLSTFFQRQIFPHSFHSLVYHIFPTLCFLISPPFFKNWFSHFFQLFCTLFPSYFFHIFFTAFPHFPHVILFSILSHAILFHTIFFTNFPQFSHVIVFHTYFIVFFSTFFPHLFHNILFHKFFHIIL